MTNPTIADPNVLDRIVEDFNSKVCAPLLDLVRGRSISPPPEIPLALCKLFKSTPCMTPSSLLRSPFSFDSLIIPYTSAQDRKNRCEGSRDKVQLTIQLPLGAHRIYISGGRL
ncbi:hypothetical protein D5086_032259 [Populus alba]|uniref:Uncharacterized protein n=1 Tax=Populus alba TaxID=43335 RepID=A0ACC4AKW1_POPAL